MTTYTPTLKARILFVLGGSIFIILALFSIFIDKTSPLIITLLGWACLILGVFGIWSQFVTKVLTDNEKIQFVVNFGLSKIKQTVYWKEVVRVYADYLVNPTVLTRLTIFAPNNTLYGNKKSVHDKMELMITMFPPSLLGDILSKIPNNKEAVLNPSIKNRFIRRYGAEVVQKFDNIGKEAHEPIPKIGIFTVKTLTGFLKTYVIVLIAFFIYNRFWGHILDGEKELLGSLVFAFFGSLTYFIYWWLFGGDASS